MFCVAGGDVRCAWDREIASAKVFAPPGARAVRPRFQDTLRTSTEVRAPDEFELRAKPALGSARRLFRNRIGPDALPVVVKHFLNLGLGLRPIPTVGTAG